ncbi:succinylglutamate desuccinylase/aspartoacylase [Linnemannia elongata]|uniref:Succinylglutamate desuccinylase/aspartoacylase n=1 Tax=Linnemannia elongata AG-77 TaxID=1314771 RepID=A0A197JGN7_9FUNG|nr:succinylglutamate desuccinylase/aspartoacylase [Linnemannia elongata]OAQ23559.1 Succinylglutamate desuccinylase/aspartoacylase [Linnemannia elongata AG-77]
MSTPIRVPVIVAKGVRPGPVVGLTAALHGNELNGIPLTHRLVLQEIQCQALHGIVVAVPVANVPGYLAQQRGFTDGTDLNRLMPGKKNGTTSQVYSYNLMTRLVKHFTHLIDLHTASKGRVNSLYVRANMQNSTTRHMARLQNPQIIVHNTSPDGSLRGAAMQQYNIPAITVEIGDPARFQKRFVKSAILGVTNILSHLKMVEDEHEVQDYDPVVCAKSYWIFTKGGGILNVLPDVNTWVRKGELIATLHNIFGQEEHRYFAPEDGIVVGKSVDPVCQSGCRILHLGVVSDHFPEGKIDDGHM